MKTGKKWNDYLKLSWATMVQINLFSEISFNWVPYNTIFIDNISEKWKENSFFRWWKLPEENSCSPFDVTDDRRSFAFRGFHCLCCNCGLYRTCFGVKILQICYNGCFYRFIFRIVNIGSSNRQFNSYQLICVLCFLPINQEQVSQTFENGNWILQ